MTYVVKISRSGKSVSSTDPRDLSLDSSFNGIIKLPVTPISGTATITTGGKTYTNVTLAHSRAYIPYSKVFLRFHRSNHEVNDLYPDNQWQIGDNFANSYPYGDIYFVPSADTTNIYLTFRSINSYAGTITCDYRVYAGINPLP